MNRLRAGDTPFRKSIQYSGKCNGATVHIKDESKNPFGTFKDRRCAALLEHHKNKKELVLVHITSGNSGYSLGMMAKEIHDREITVVNIVPKGLPKGMLKMLRSCSVVEEMDLDKKVITEEMMLSIAKRAAGFEGQDDCIVGVEDYDLEGGYRQIIKEIHSSGVKPTHIFCPVGEGELAVELASEAVNIWGKNAPNIIGATIKQNIFARGKRFLRSPGKSIADKLVNGYSKFRELLERLVNENKVEISVQSERRIADEYSYLNSIGIQAEPSAAAAFCAATAYKLGPKDNVVIINTGKGIYDHKAVDRIWRRTLKRIGKYAAAVLAGVALTAGGFIYQQRIENENKLLRLQQQEMAMKAEWEGLGRLKSEAEHLLDSDGDGDLSHDEYRGIFKILTKRKDTTEEHPWSYSHELDKLTESELRYFIKYRTYQRTRGNFENYAINKIEEEYNQDDKSDEASIKERLRRACLIKQMNEGYLAGEFPKKGEPSMMEKMMGIYMFRQVKRAGGAGDYCTMREFDLDNPFDPDKETLCR